MGALRKEHIPRYSISDYKHWEDAWELIYGYPYAMAPSPIVTHQSVSMNLSIELNNQLKDCKKCQVLYEIDWEISNDTIVRPDNIVICYEPDEKINKKPEMIFEITSPSTVKKDEGLKFELYEREGVKYYTIVYSDKNVAKSYILKDGRYIKLGDYSDEKAVFQLDECEVEVDFSNIWRK